jgi:hypothetical protein
MEELLAFSYTLNAKGLIQLVSKDDMRSALGHSPDYADATKMAVGGKIGGCAWGHIGADGCVVWTHEW